MNKDINLKYAVRNISMSEAFNFTQSKRAICSIEVIFNILNSAINQNIKSYMFIFAYKCMLYSVGYEINKSVNYMLGLPNSSMINFTSIEELKEYSDVKNMIDNVTVIQELLEGIMKELTEVPVSSNPILKDYLVDSTSPEYNLNISEEITQLYQEGAGTKIGIKNVLKFVGTIILMIVIYGIVIYFLG